MGRNKELVSVKGMPRIPPRYVLTGGPGSGAGTLLRELAIRGYHTVPEAARHHIERNNIRGISTLELRRHNEAFQNEVLRLKIEIENITPKRRVVFFERGIPDSLAYFELDGLPNSGLPRRLSGRYRKVFWLSPLPVYRKDRARIEDEATSRKIGGLIKKWYRRLGYDLVTVPVMYLEERAEFVLARL